MDINGTVALVTGAGKRIGREIAVELARRGARIAVHYRSSEREAREVAQNRGAAFQADLTNANSIEAMLRAIQEQFGRLDILVNSASVFTPGTALETGPDEWDLQLDTNARGPFLVARRAAWLMRSSGGGKIVNIVDVAGEVIWPGYFAYSVSKAALIAVNRGLAKALAPEIQVNGIAPGPVLFPDHYTEEQKQAAIDRTLLKRAGSPKDVVNAAVFLIENDYITGEVIHVDGGRHVL